MNKYLESLRVQRKKLLDITQSLSVQQYNTVPPGYNNNVIWNMGHTLVVSESYLYRTGAFPPPTHEFEVSGFKRGSKPEIAFNSYGISLIRASLLETVSTFKERNGEVKASNSSYENVSEESLQFILFHDAIHYRTIEKLIQLV